jgi:hypothetical protein
MAPKSEYSDKQSSPFSVRLSKVAAEALASYRKQAGLSEGDFVEWLLRETSPIKAIKRARPGNLTERASFRLSDQGDELLRRAMSANRATGGDVVEAYLNRLAAA